MILLTSATNRLLARRRVHQRRAHAAAAHRLVDPEPGDHAIAAPGVAGNASDDLPRLVLERRIQQGAVVNACRVRVELVNLLFRKASSSGRSSSRIRIGISGLTTPVKCLPDATRAATRRPASQPRLRTLRYPGKPARRCTGSNFLERRETSIAADQEDSDHSLPCLQSI